jgi:hypothetical protein
MGANPGRASLARGEQDQGQGHLHDLVIALFILPKYKSYLQREFNVYPLKCKNESLLILRASIQ